MNLPLLIVAAFLLLTLVVGLYVGRKTTTLREYAVGDKKFTTATLVATMLATRVGGGALVRNAAQIHNNRIFCIYTVLTSISRWLISPLALRIGPFMQHLSIAETIGSVYGRAPRIITALAGICAYIAVLASEIIVLSKSIAICVNVNPDYARYITILSTLILISYSASGGIRAVTFTDVLQFATFSIIIPLLTWFMFKQINQPLTTIIPVLQSQAQFHFSNFFHFDTKLVAVLALFLSGLVSNANSTTMQRLYMASSPIQANKVLSYSGLFGFLISTCIMLIALFVFVSAPALPKENVWPYVINHIPPIFQGLVAISLLAMTMSTADSCLNSCAIMVSHDIVESLKGISLPLTHRFRIVRCIAHVVNLLVKIIPYAYPLRLARLTSLVLGLFAMLLAFKCSDLLELLKLALLFAGPIRSAPFILALFGFRGTSRTALIGIATGILAILAWNKWVEPLDQEIGIVGGFPCMMANGLAMLAAHYFLPQPAGTGWVAPDDTYRAYQQNKAYAAKLRKESLYAIFANPKAYLIALKPSDSKLIGSGLYIIIHGLLSLVYCWDDGWHLGPILLFFIGFSLVSYVLILKKHAIPDWIITAYFWLALLCALPIHSLCNWRYLPLPLLMLALSCTHIALLLFLLPRYVGLLLAMPLFYLYACCCCKIAFLPLLGLGILLFGFMFYAKNRIDRSTAQRKLMELRSTYEQRVSLETIYNQASLARLDAYAGSHLLTAMGKTLQETCQNLDTATPIKKEVKLFLKKLDRVGHIWMEHAHAERKMALHPKAIFAVDITSTIVKIYGYIQTLDSSTQFFLRNQSSMTALEADPALLECLLMLNMEKLSKSRLGANQELTLTLADTTLHYGQLPTDAEGATDTSSLTLPAVAFVFATDRGIKEIRSHYTVMHTAAYKVLPKIEKQFYQLESRQIVEAHGGYTEIVEKGDHLTCLYVLPVKGKQVMHLKTYDASDLVAAKVAETEESVTQEKEVISLLTSNSTLTQEKVTEAIAFIKNAHGLVVRKSGAPYYTHPMEVAKILLEVTADPDTILAGLLHDMVEDTPITLNQIKTMYGAEVASIVDKVTEYNTHGYPWKLGKIEQNGILDVCGDIRVVQVKLADRLHNLRTLYARKPESQQRIARETLAFYIPWGERNGGPQAWLREMRQICGEILNYIGS